MEQAAIVAAKVEEGGHLASAAAFVEGGIQDACDDSCSICLEAFVESDPSTVTTCKHEFHLQCILDWCQRSSQCPMCWQQLGFKDSISQDIFEGVVRERNIRLNQERSTNILHQLALSDFELQHLLVGRGDIQIDEHIFQTIAAAAAMGSARQSSRRDGLRGRSGSHGRPQFLAFTTNENAPSVGPVTVSSTERRSDNELIPPIVAVSSSAPQSVHDDEAAGRGPHVSVQAHSSAVLTSGTSTTPGRISTGRNTSEQTTPVGQDSPGPSDLTSFSESLKSRLNSVSMRYKESITKSTRGWRERLFSRSNTVVDLGSEVRREVNAGIATVSRMMERLETRESRRNSGSSTSAASEAHHLVEPSTDEVNQNNTATRPNGSPPSVSFISSTSSQSNL